MSLSDRWFRWLRCFGTSDTSTHRVALTLKYVQRVVLSSLANEGFDVPCQRALKETLEHGLKPIVRLAGPLQGPHHKAWTEVTFVHLVNMIWHPLLVYSKALVDGRPAPWSSTLSKHAEVLILEMQGLVSEPDTTLIMDDWLVYVQDTIKRLVDVTVPQDVLFNALGPIVPLTLAPTRANALSMLRTHACASKVVGHISLATEGFEVPRRSELKETLEHGLEPLVLQDASTSIRLHWLEVSLVHMINMMWEPLLRYIEASSTTGLHNGPRCCRSTHKF